MLNLNIKRVFAMRNIENPYIYLVRHGISRPTAWNLLNNNTTQIKNKHLELICELLNCEPNDLYEWTPSKDTANPDNHPLKDLRRQGKAPSYSEIIRQIPLDKIAEMKGILNGLSNEE